MATAHTPLSCAPQKRLQTSPNMSGEWEGRAPPPSAENHWVRGGSLLPILLNQATILEDGHSHSPTTFPRSLTKSPISELTSWYLVFFS